MLYHKCYLTTTFSADMSALFEKYNYSSGLGVFLDENGQWFIPDKDKISVANVWPSSADIKNLPLIIILVVQ